MENLINTIIVSKFCMKDNIIDIDENISKMFSGKGNDKSSDQELALHIIHKFNICKDTLDTMPAFDEHLKLLFSEEL
jgi:hypothetical protein